MKSLGEDVNARVNHLRGLVYELEGRIKQESTLRADTFLRIEQQLSLLQESLLREQQARIDLERRLRPVATS